MYFFEYVSCLSLEKAFKYEELGNGDRSLERLSCVSLFPVNDLVAATSGSHLYLWKRRDGLLGVLKRTRSSLEEFGLNKEVLWCPSGEKLCIITRRGNVILYNLVWDEDLLKRFTPVFTPDVQIIRRKGRYILELQSSNQLSRRVAHQVALAEGVLLFIGGGCSFAFVSWESANGILRIQDLRSLPFYKCRSEVRSVEAPYNGRVFGMIGESGKAYICRWCPEQQTFKEGICVHSPHLAGHYMACSISINGRGDFCAIGTVDGSITIYEILRNGADSNVDIVHTRKLDTRGGSISSISWSTSGLVLGICLPNSRLCFISNNGTDMPSLELEVEGCHSCGRGSGRIHWGDSDLSLIYAVHDTERLYVNIIDVLRHPLSFLNQVDNAQQPCLVTTGRVYLPKVSITRLDFTNQKSSEWSMLPLPEDLTSITAVSRSHSGNYLLICEREGFVCYSIFEKTWMKFATKEEKEVFSYNCGICWYKDFAIMGCWDNVDELYSVLCFSCSRDFTLGEMSIRTLESPVCYLLTSKNTLYIYSRDNMLATYRISLDKNLQITLTVKVCVNLSAIIPEPSKILSMDVCEGVSTNIRSVVTLSSSGNLIYHTLLGGEWSSSTIDTKVDFFVLGERFTTDIPVLKDIIWSFSKSTYKILLPKACILDKYLGSANSIVICPSPENAIVYYIEQGVHINLLPESLLSTNLKTDIFLSDCVANMLLLGMDKEALELAYYYRNKRLFPHLMEITFSNIVQNGGKGENLQSTIKCFNNFLIDTLGESKTYFNIVTLCLRKTDISYWGSIFSIVGSPLDTFNACVSYNSPRLIIHHYMIIQTAETPDAARAVTATLSATLIERLDFKTLHKIFNFIDHIGQAESYEYKESVCRAGLNSLVEAGLPPRDYSLFPDSKFWFLEPFATVSAINWLKSSRIIEVHSTCIGLDFPLEKMLSFCKTQSRSPPAILQRLIATSKLLPPQDCKCHISIDYEQRYSLMHSKTIPPLRLTTLTPQKDPSAEQCLKPNCPLHKVLRVSAPSSHTLKCIHAATISAGLYDWALVFSILLLDPQDTLLTLIRITSENPNATFTAEPYGHEATYSIKEWSAAVNMLGCPALSSLATSVEHLYGNIGAELMTGP